MRRAGISAAAVGAGFLAASLATGRASAHEVGLSRGDYTVTGRTVKAQLLFARRELAGLVAGLDADHDGAVTPAELAAGKEALEGALVGRIAIRGDGAPCPGTLEGAELVDQDGIAVHAVYRCAKRPQQLTVALTFLDDVPFGHRHLVRATAGAASTDHVLSQRSASFSLDLPAESAESVAAAEPPAPTSALRRGTLQVIAHPEAPAFLLALLVTCAGLRDALLAASAFAAAAAAGLVLGASGAFVPGARVLGPAIALSLVYAGLDAAASPDTRARWRIAVPFGVVHGLGWAAALAAGEGGSLAAFGAGALLALAVTIGALVPATLWALRRPAWPVRRVLGAAVVAVGTLGLFTGHP
jgi:hypothetical protein